MKRSVPLNLLALEDRTTPAIFGNAWADPGHLSVSFAPDGTDIGADNSSLSARLDSAMGRSQWQGALLRALQTWAQYTNLNFHVVADSGQPFGFDAPVQGSPQAGDIRFGARPLNLAQFNLNELAIANPFDLVSGYAGEVILNSNTAFSNGGSPGTHDLYTVALHEVGHALGLAHSDDPASVMSEDYVGAKIGLAASDIAAIQKIYGVRQDDRFEGSAGNDTLRTATAVKPINTLGQLVNVLTTPGGLMRGDITETGDVDVYTFKTGLLPLLAGVAVRTSDVSLLQGKLTLLDSAGRVVASVQAGGPGEDLTINSLLLEPLSTYYVRVEAGTSGPLGTGAYKMAVGSLATQVVGALAPVEFDTPGGTVADYSDVDGNSRNDSIARATNLGDARPGSDARWDFAGHAKIDSLTDADYYRVHTRIDSPPVLVVTAYATRPGTLDPLVTVFDSAGRALNARVLQNHDYSYSIQIEGLRPGADYYIRVQADPGGLNLAGSDYFLGVDFRQDAIRLETLTSGTLTPSQPTAAQALTVTQAASYRFELSAGLSAASGQAVRMIINDAAGNEVLRLAVRAGETVAADVMLLPGTYTAHFEAKIDSPVGFEARYLATTDPMGPEMMDPEEGNSPPPGTSVSSGTATASGTGTASGTATATGTGTATYTGTGTYSTSGGTGTGTGTGTSSGSGTGTSYYPYTWDGYSPPQW